MTDFRKLAEETDFAALLEAAKRKHYDIRIRLNKHAHDGDASATDAITLEWHRWVKENLTDRGIQMTVDGGTERPTSLFVVVAGNF